nr:hypothetical protein [uncultured Noviherbaspirillum sp.]
MDVVLGKRTNIVMLDETAYNRLLKSQKTSSIDALTATSAVATNASSFLDQE